MRTRTSHAGGTNAGAQEVEEPAAATAIPPSEVLTPSLFQQGVAESARTPRTPGTDRTPRLETAEQAPNTEGVNDFQGGLELSEEGKARHQQILQAAFALTEPPSPSGFVVNLSMW